MYMKPVGIFILHSKRDSGHQCSDVVNLSILRWEGFSGLLKVFRRRDKRELDGQSQRRVAMTRGSRKSQRNLKMEAGDTIYGV